MPVVNMTTGCSVFKSSRSGGFSIVEQTLTLRAYRVAMGLNDLNKSRSPDDGPPDDISWWRDGLEEVFPHAPARRLSIALDVNPRLGQKWAASREYPSKRAQEFVAAQRKALSDIRPTNTLERLVQEWHDAGLHVEAIAAQLAAMHERITGRSVD